MKILRKYLVWILLLGILLAWVLWGNTALTQTQYTLQNDTLPASFDGFRIAQVSDLHNARFGKDNQTLLAMLEAARPDLIAITGDLLDSRKTDLQIAVAFAEEAVKLAPVYYVPGNHESRLPEAYETLRAALAEAGVTVLENESIPLSAGGDTVTLTGLLDPDFGIPWPDSAPEGYHIVLSHRPELLETYAELGFDLVLTGHAHGGQFRLPFVGGLFAPHQGFLPEYDAGVFYWSDTAMVVSRGLGNSAFPLRLGNRPELVLITLESV